MDFVNEVVALLDHPEPPIRVGACFNFDTIEINCASMRFPASPALLRHAESLARCLQDREPRVRAVAARVYGNLGDQKLAPHLAPLLNDTESSVRFVAASSLWSLCKLEVVPGPWSTDRLPEQDRLRYLGDVIRLIDDPSPDVRAEVHWLLRGGK